MQPPQQHQAPPESLPPAGGRGSNSHAPSPSAAAPRIAPTPRPQPPQAVQMHPASSIPHGFVPAYLPGSASLVEELDQRILIVLRDGKHIVGTLSTFDQYSNLVLLNAVERRILLVDRAADKSSSATIVNNNNCYYYYTDIDLGGLYCVRGENMVLMGRHAPEARGGQRLEWADWQQKAKEQQGQASTLATVASEWDFDSDLIA